MDKLKQVLSHGQKKDDVASHDHKATDPITNVRGEGSHLHTANEEHPIYDEFKGKRTHDVLGEPNKTSDQPPHFSNAPAAPPIPQSVKERLYQDNAPINPIGQDPITLNPQSDRRTHTDVSNASIKSGVTGLPQGHSSAKQPSQAPEVVTDTNREFPLAGGVTSRKQATETSPSHSHDFADSPSHKNADSNKPGVLAGTTAAVTGALSSAAAAVYPGSKDKHAGQDETSRQHIETSPSHSKVLSEPSHSQTTTGTGDQRGGLSGATSAVTGAMSSAAAAVYPGSKDKHSDLGENHRHPAETSPSHSNVLSEPTHSHTQTTTGATDNRGLSGATSAVTGAMSSAAAAVYPGSKDKHSDLGDKHNQARETLPSYSGVQPEHHNLSGAQPEHQSLAGTHGSSDDRDAFPGVAAAVYPESTHKHAALEDTPDTTAHPTEKRGTFSGAAAAITGALSSAAAAVYHPGSKDKNVDENKPATTRGESYSNRHVPGQFPDPTPIEERSQPTYGDHVPGQFPDSTPTEERSQPTYGAKSDNRNVTAMPDESDYKPDTAIAGSIGAGLGAYPPGAHATKETTRDTRDSQDKSAKHDDNPYTASQLDPRVDSKPATSSEKHRLVPSAVSSSNDRKVVDQERHEKTTPDQTRQPEHHTGRNVAFAGAGAAALGGLYVNRDDKDKSGTGPAPYTTGPHAGNVTDTRIQPDSQQQKQHHAGPTHEDPASKTTGPHKSNLANIVDPRVKPEPEKMKDHSTDGPHKSDMLNKLDPRVKSQDKSDDQQHHGRDAAVVGGAGAAGLGAHGAAKHYGEHPAAQPSFAMEDQRYDPSAKGAHHSQQPQEHHHGRDAAATAGAGTLGYGAYQAAKPSENTSYNQPHSHGHEQPAQQPVRQPIQPSQHTQASQPTEHHHGRDAALAGGAGAAGYGAYKASHSGSDKTHDNQKPYENQQHIQQPIPQHVQQTAPQSYQQQPTKQTQQPQHHHGRDAAFVGGTGAAGYGAYKASQPGDRTHEAQKPYESQQQQYQQPTQQPQQSEHHYGRDAAVAGGAGAAGYGAYKAFQPGDDASRNAPKSYDNQQLAQHSTQPLAQQPAQSVQQPSQEHVLHHRYDSVGQPQKQQQAQQQQQSQDQHHHGRDAAVAGGAGLAGAGAAYGYSQHEAEKAEKERIKQLEQEQKQHQKELEHEQKQHQKELEKQQKHDQKVAEKEEKAHQKEVEKDQKYAAKVAAAEEKKHHKEEEKEQKHAAQVAAAKEKEHEKQVEKEQRHAAEVAAAEEKRRQHEAEQQQLAMQKQREAEEKEREKEQHHDEPKEKKHHHILPFLHRDKKDKQKATDDQNVSPNSSPRHSRDHGRPSTTEAAYGPEAVDRNKLHKDPPPGHPAHDALAGKIEHLGHDGPLHVVKPDEKLHSGVYGIHDTPGDNSGPTGPTGTNY